MFIGKNNTVIFGEDVQITNTKFEVVGSNNTITIGRNVLLRDSVIHVGDVQSRLVIHDQVDVGAGAKWTVLEGTKIEIGKGCMFSTNSHISSSDAHSVMNVSVCRNRHMRTRINAARNVLIGQNVWFGEDVTCLKGVHIKDGAIFGSKCLITRGVYEGNTIYAGIPCRKIRENVCWIRERIQ